MSLLYKIPSISLKLSYTFDINTKIKDRMAKLNCQVPIVNKHNKKISAVASAQPLIKYII